MRYTEFEHRTDMIWCTKYVQAVYVKPLDVYMYLYFCTQSYKSTAAG